MARLWYGLKRRTSSEESSRARHLFEAIAASIAQGGLLDVLAHPNRERYPDQKILVVQIRDYVYAVPSVEQAKGTWFLKTAFPSRRLTKLYATRTGR